MSKNLHHIATVSLSTVGSRVLGLARDVMIFAAFGASIWSSAFILAFTLPNLFRRLLGEGALTSAVVPLFSDVLKQGGLGEAFRFLNSVLLRLVVVLVALTLFMILSVFLVDLIGFLPERWSIASGFIMTLMPYMIFICLAAIFAAALNTVGRFLSASSTPILLNLSMIGSLAVGMWLKCEANVLIWWLCGGVMLGGVLQLAVPAYDLWAQGWRPKVEEADQARLSELWRLFLPGLIGAAILQVNILVSRVLAYSLDETATSLLYAASRLMELPLGVFTISVVTVFFPLMARAFSANDEVAFSTSLLSGMRLVLAISVPAGVGLIILGEPILSTLFRWGAFDRADVLATVPLVAIYGFGLPFYSIATLATRGLHASKEMKIPVRIAGVSLLINAFGGLVLMQFFAVNGLAAANVIAAIVQSILMWLAVAKTHPLFKLSSLTKSFQQIAISCIALAVVCFMGNYFFEMFDLTNKAHALGVVCIVIPAAVAAYFGLLYFLKFEEMSFIQERMNRLTGRR